MDGSEPNLRSGLDPVRRPAHEPVTRLEWVASTVIIVAAFVIAVPELAAVAARWSEVEVGADYVIYRDAAQRWLSGGGFYMPHQLTGPYDVVPPVVLYPPPSLFLFVPFVFLPAVLWWIIPLGITAVAIHRHRPRPLAWAIVLFCLANPTTLSSIVWGNPALWLLAALAAGTHVGWPSVALFIKPTLFPFALVGVWRRSWWLALGAGAVVSLPFLPMWFDYVNVIRYADGPSGWFGYSTAQIPLLLMPIAAWLGTTVASPLLRRTPRRG